VDAGTNGQMARNQSAYFGVLGKRQGDETGQSDMPGGGLLPTYLGRETAKTHTMKILIGCERSGKVRDAMLKKGHDALSCDIEPTDKPGPHYQGDIRDILGNGWDMMIAFPPCTHLAVSGARHFPAKRADGRQQAGIAFFLMLANADIPQIALENPIGIMSTIWRKPDQIIQPWQFGHVAMKSTCLWLKGLPLLQPTQIVDKGPVKTHASGKRNSEWSCSTWALPKHLRAKVRSETFQGIADAMAEQWG